jgi:plastocyanin
MFRLRLAVPVVVLALTTAAVLGPSVIVVAQDAPAVSIHEGGDPTSWGYAPTSATVAAGQPVTFTNSGTFAHDAAATDGSWNVPLLDPGASAQVTFTTPGTYTYICTPHPWMQGTIIVTGN